jgi:hypothetical protein
MNLIRKGLTHAIVFTIFGLAYLGISLQKERT